jgi:hypothetical protein
MWMQLIGDMKQLWKYGLMVTLLALPLGLFGQLRDSSRTCIHVGYYRDIVNTYEVATAAYERSLTPRISANASIGINPISKSDYPIPVWRFYWSAGLELRYYFALRRQYLLSGFFFGASLRHNHLGFYFNHTSNPYLRSYWNSLGPELGYQQVIGSRLRIGGGISMGFYPRMIEEGYDAQGNPRGRIVWPHNYTYSYFFRIGFSF